MQANRAVYWDPNAAGGYGAPVAIAGLGASFSYGVSETGAVAGSALNPSNGGRQVPFYWSGVVGQSAVFIYLLAGIGDPSSGTGYGVNSLGQVVGTQAGVVNGVLRYRAFVWDAVGGTRALDDLVGGWAFTFAHAINDRGQILARGTRGGNAGEEWVLISTTPVPEPGTWLLLGVGLMASGGVAVIRGRRRGMDAR